MPYRLLIAFLLLSCPLGSATSPIPLPRPDAVAMDMQRLLQAAFFDVRVDIQFDPASACASVERTAEALQPLLREYLTRTGDGFFHRQLLRWHRLYCATGSAPSPDED